MLTDRMQTIKNNKAKLKKNINLKKKKNQANSEELSKPGLISKT